MKAEGIFKVALVLLFLLLFKGLAKAEFAMEDLNTVKADLLEVNLNEEKYSLLIGTGLTLGAFFADSEVKRSSKHWKSGTNDAISDFGNFAGNPIVDFSLSSILYATAKRDSTLERASFTALESVFFSTAITETIAYSLGRKRPDEHDGASTFKPFSGSSSFPSAHAASSMAFFSTFARYYGAPCSYLFYSAFAATAFGRIYENRHYLSDVAMGGTIGYVVSSYLYERHREGKKVSYVPIFFVSNKTIFLGLSKQF